MEIAVFEFVLKSESNLFLPAFKGATFRGKFGHVLKKVICFNKSKNCENCVFTENCPYIYLFMSKHKNKEDTIKPFVIKPPLGSKQFFLKDEKFYLQMTLIGKAIEYFPYFIYCFLQMGQEGIGNPPGKFKIDHVWNINSMGQKKEIYNSEKKILLNEIDRISLDEITYEIKPQVTLNFLTPTQIKKDGRIIGEFNFETLLKAILRRYSRLRYVHGDGQNVKYKIDWKAARSVEVLSLSIKEKRFRRYSNKQKLSIPVRGITGKVVLRGNLSPFIHWLKIGEYLHVGKGATFGLGWYRMV